VKRPDTPAAEVKRLARIAELARTARRHERALERAMRAAMDHGISTRKIAAVANVSHVTVWRLARPGKGQPGLAREDVKLPSPVGKPKESRK
jgi:hypothetical protein